MGLATILTTTQLLFMTTKSHKSIEIVIALMVLLLGLFAVNCCLFTYLIF